MRIIEAGLLALVAVTCYEAFDRLYGSPPQLHCPPPPSCEVTVDAVVEKACFTDKYWSV